MKKIVKIVFCNFMIFILLFIALNFLAHFISYRMSFANKNLYDLLIGISSRDENKLLKHYLYDSGYRPIENKNSNKHSIIIFGCSFAYGEKLQDSETFSYQLGKLTKRPIYNRAIPGWGVKEMYWQLKEADFYKQIKNPPEYIIYVYIFDHIKRIRISRNYWDNKYSIFYNYDEKKRIFKRNKLYEYMMQIPVIYAICNGAMDIKQSSYHDIVEFKHYLEESKKEISKHYKNNTKFVILSFGPETLPDEFYSLQDDELIILDASEVAGVDLYTKEYHIAQNDSHPNAKAWEILTPKLVEKLEMNKD